MRRIVPKAAGRSARSAAAVAVVPVVLAAPQG